jgi:hypothetical protein
VAGARIIAARSRRGLSRSTTSTNRREERLRQTAQQSRNAEKGSTAETKDCAARSPRAPSPDEGTNPRTWRC